MVNTRVIISNYYSILVGMAGFAASIYFFEVLPWFDLFELLFNSGTSTVCFDMYYTYSSYSFYEICLIFFGFATLFFAFCSVQSKNPIFSVLFLVLVFFSLGSTLILFGFYFIGLLVIFIYVGAISILFLFVLMIVDLRVLFLDKEFLFENKFISFFLNVFFLIIGIALLLFIFSNVSFFWKLLNSSVCYFKALLSFYEYKFRVFSFSFSFDYWKAILELNAFIKALVYNFTPYKFEVSGFSSLIKGFSIDFEAERFGWNLYAIKKESGVGFLETFYSEADIFGLGQYVFNYFMFQTFLVFCILLICLFGAIAVVINKSDTRYTRSGQNTLQVKSSDFTIS